GTADTLRLTDPPAGLADAFREAGYEVLAELGRGGMGLVYQARQVRLNRLVALKVIRGRALSGPEDALRFQLQGEPVARLNPPHIVQIYEIGQVQGQPYFALEFVGGGSLADRLAAGPLAPREAAALVETLARAMHYAHGQGVVHRDLKPANILLAGVPSSTFKVPSEAAPPTLNFEPGTLNCSPKIADFGMAKL